MRLDILKYHVVRDITGSRAKISPRPEMAPPIAFPNLRKFYLDFIGRSPLYLLHELADRYLWWYLNEHVDVIIRQDATDDGYSHFMANLSNDLTYPFP